MHKPGAQYKPKYETKQTTYKIINYKSLIKSFCSKYQQQPTNQ